MPTVLYAKLREPVWDMDPRHIDPAIQSGEWVEVTARCGFTLEVKTANGELYTVDTFDIATLEERGDLP